ncbi:MAG TPA: chorismate-binding protein, partial [Bacteroidia bacterium]|nr:chorismate-binding protein [Bacteroidia bacterium]
MRQSIAFPLPSGFSIEHLLKKVELFSEAVVLNSNIESQNFQDPYCKYDLIAAIGSLEELKCNKDSFSELEKMLQKEDWHFGYFTYDLKNELENLNSSNPDFVQFPSLHFFRPRWVLRFTKDLVRVDFDIQTDTEQSALTFAKELLHFPFPEESETEEKPPPKIRERVSKEDYLSTVRKIQKHIQRGDIYEMNYCVEFFAEQADINPAESYSRLNTISPMPFSCYYKLRDHYL